MSRNTTSTAGEAFGILLLYCGTTVLIFGTALFNTWVLSHLWGWFVTPIFGFAVPKLYLLYGLILTIAFFQHIEPTKNKTTAVFESIIKGFVILGFGWTVQALFA